MAPVSGVALIFRVTPVSGVALIFRVAPVSGVALNFQTGQPLLQLAQGPIAVQHIVNSTLFARLHLLWQVRDDPTSGNR